MHAKLRKFVICMSKLSVYTIILCHSLSMAFAVESYSQQKQLSEIKVGIDLPESIQLLDLINRIETHSAFTFVYSEPSLADKSIQLPRTEGVSMKDLLTEVSTQAHVDIMRVNETITIKPGTHHGSYVAEATDENFEKIQVTGTILDENGEPLPGASVMEAGTTNGTVTDVEGHFNLMVEEGATLRISFIGYAAEEVVVTSDNRSINLSLLPDIMSLEEVVVVGYGEVKKEDLTGAVASVKAANLAPGANVNIQQTLQGKVAGVNIVQKGGEPGAGMSINIRGISSINASNSPLYVIDGVPVNNQAVAASGGSNFVSVGNARNPLNAMNPQDIESIEILKDASATAIYGARGSNGVVLITTKGGKAGQMKVNYDGYVGTQEVSNRLEMLNAQDYKTILNELIDEGASGDTVDEIEGNGTDWQDLIYRSARVQDHNMSVSGGKDNVTYYTSLSYFNQEGVLKHSSMDRYSARVNLKVAEARKYAFDLNLNTSYIDDNFAPNGVGTNENAGVIYDALNYDPTIAPYDADGNLQTSDATTGIDQPLIILKGMNAFAKTFRTFGNLSGEYFIVPELSVKVRLGTDINNARRDVWVSGDTKAASGTDGTASIITAQRDYYLSEATINYKKEFTNSDVNAVVGATYEQFRFAYFSGSGQGYDLDDLQTDGIGSGDATLNTMSSSRESARYASFLGRVNYNYLKKYLLTASLRADGSSKFGPNNRWGYFPSAAVAWKAHMEDFMQGIKSLTQLKVRASYGAIGNAGISNYAYFSTFDYTGYALFGGDTKQASISSGTTLYNPNLKWESAQQLDVGIDFGIFNDRLTGTIDYYNRKTTDLLLSVSLPRDTGYANQTQNVGSMRNSGVEFSLNATLLQKGDFTWTAGGNFTTVKNEVLSLGSLDYTLTGGQGQVSGVTIIKKGLPLNSFYGLKVDGVWQENDDFSVTNEDVQAGDLKFHDKNGDGDIDSDDWTVIGNPFPDFTYGFTTDLKYKNVALNIFFQGSHGASMLNSNFVDTYNPVNFRRNRVAKLLKNRWTADNPTNKYPSFVNTLNSDELVNERTVLDASYLRLQSVRLTYTIPTTNIHFARNFSVYATATNLFTITKYPGADPTTSSATSDVFKIDFNSYPMTRTYMMGVNISF